MKEKRSVCNAGPYGFGNTDLPLLDSLVQGCPILPQEHIRTS